MRTFHLPEPAVASPPAPGPATPCLPEAALDLDLDLDLNAGDDPNAGFVYVERPPPVVDDQDDDLGPQTG